MAFPFLPLISLIAGAALGVVASSSTSGSDSTSATLEKLREQQLEIERERNKQLETREAREREVTEPTTVGRQRPRRGRALQETQFGLLGIGDVDKFQ